jgi:hypothetical protein
MRGDSRCPSLAKMKFLLGPDFRDGSRLCENAKTLNRDRTSYSFRTILGAHTASQFNFEIELENIILVELQVFKFSHSLGQKRRFDAPPITSGLPQSTDIILLPTVLPRRPPGLWNNPFP